MAAAKSIHARRISFYTITHASRVRANNAGLPKRNAARTSTVTRRLQNVNVTAAIQTAMAFVTISHLRPHTAAAARMRAQYPTRRIPVQIAVVHLNVMTIM